MASRKSVSFHSDHALITILVNGVPLSVHGTVTMLVTAPSQMSQVDRQGWSQISKESAAAASVELVVGTGE